MLSEQVHYNSKNNEIIKTDITFSVPYFIFRMPSMFIIIIRQLPGYKLNSVQRFYQVRCFQKSGEFGNATLIYPQKNCESLEYTDL